MFQWPGYVPAHSVPKTKGEKAAKTTRISSQVKDKASGKKVTKMPTRKLDDLDMISQYDIDNDPKNITRDERTFKGILKLSRNSAI